MKPPRIGALRHRIVLETAIRSGDGGGGASVIWTPVAEIWAAIEPRTGTEQIVGEAVSGRISHQITVRHRTDIEPARRVRFGARVFDILAVLDIDERRRLLNCLCREELL